MADHKLTTGDGSVSPENERSYIAFISYRHTPLDREAAERVQKKIENYVVPKEYREQAGGRKLGMCFRDEDELPASSSLTDSIYYALDHTKFLIVICTPDLPLSKWCEAEIKYFLKTHDRDHILAVLADGTPDVSFSPFMLHDFDEEGSITKDWEPLAANIAGEGHTINKKALNKEVVRLYAAMIGCPFDALWQRERRARTNRIITAGVGVIAVLAVFLGVVLNRNAQISAQNEQIRTQNDQITAQNDELTEKNDEIQKQNDRITEQNDKIEEQNTQLQSQLSKVLVDSGLVRLESGDRKGALQDALDALESGDPAVYDPRAEKLLADALGAYKTGQLQGDLVYQQTTMITQIRITADCKYALLLDHVGTVRCLDLSDYSVLWDFLVKDADANIYSENYNDYILVKTAASLLCLSVKDGSVLWSYDQDSSNYFQCVSDDGSLFAVLDTKTGEEGLALSSDTSKYPNTGYFRPVYAVFIDTRTGKEVNRLELPGDETWGFYRLTDDFKEKYFATDFSEDNQKFVCVLPFRTKAEETGDVKEFMFALDLKNNSLLPGFAVSETKNEQIPFDIFFGADIDPSGEQIFIVQNKTDDEAVFIHGLYAEEGGYRHVHAEKGFYFGSDTISLYDVRDGINRTVPMLSSADHLVFFTDKDILVCNKARENIDRNFSTDTNIISAEWLDLKEEVLQVVTEGGSVLRMDLSGEEGYALDSKQYFFLEQSELRCHSSVNGGIVANKADGSCLIVQNSAPGTLIRLSYRTDPGVQILQEAAEEVPVDRSETMIAFLPDSDTGMLFLNGKDVITFDRKTGEVQSRSEMAEEFKHGIQSTYLLDKTHFVQSNRLYDTKSGNVSEYVKRPEGLETLEDSNIYLNKRIKSGDLLTMGMFWMPVAAETEDTARIMLMYNLWYNNDADYSIFLLDASDQDISLAVIGENGLVMVSGDDWTQEGTDVSFQFADVLNNLTYTQKRNYPKTVSHLAALGTEKPMGAVLYENGELQLICFWGDDQRSTTLFDTDTGRFSSQNEALAMCFSEGDQYLVMLSSAGRLIISEVGDLYDNPEKNDHPDLEKYNDPVDLFKNNLRDYDNFVKADMMDDGKTMVIYAGYESHFCNAVLMDTDSWIQKAEIPNAYAIDEETGTVYAYTDNANGTGSSAIVTYPVRTLEDLKAWAKEVLENE